MTKRVVVLNVPEAQPHTVIHVHHNCCDKPKRKRVRVAKGGRKIGYCNA